MKEYNNIVFFDGVCTLCNRAVSILVAMDKHQRLKFTSLQGDFSNSFLSKDNLESLESIHFWSNGVLYRKSEAILMIMIEIGGLYLFLSKTLNIVPLFILDNLYDLISRYRYSFFGKEDICRIPSNEEKERFLH